MYNEVMENTDFVIEHIDKEVKVITDRPSSVVNYPANTDFFIENIDDNVISIAHSLNIEASEVEFRPANTDFFIENIDNNVIMIAESLELTPSEVTIRPVNTDFFVENIDKNLIAIAEYYELEPSRVVLRPANTDMFIENIDRNVTLIKSRTNVIIKSGSFINVDVPDGGTMQLTAIDGNATQTTYSGKNLVVNTYQSPQTISGVTFTSNADGTITANGTATAGINFYPSGSSAKYDISAGTYTMSPGSTFGSDTTYFLYIDGTTGTGIYWDSRTTGHFTQTVPAGGGEISPRIVIRSGVTLNNVVFKFQLESGSSATSFEPYVGGTASPNPSYPQPISVVTGENVVNVVGKNLIDSSKLASYVLEGTISNHYYYDAKLWVEAEIGKTYTISLNVDEVDVVPYVFTILLGRASAGQPTVEIMSINDLSTVGGRIEATFSVTQAQIDTAGGNMLFMRVPRYRTATTSHYKISNIMLEIGDSASSFEPYQAQEFPIDLGSIELAKIGTYQDRIYKDEGKWYIEKQIGKVVLNGSESWWIANGTLYTAGITDYATTGNTPISDYFTGQSNVLGAGDVVDNRIAFNNSTQYNYRFYIRCTSKFASVSDLTTWLGAHPTTVYYALATPTTTEITDETLLEQLNFVADMYEGINNISFIGTGAQGTIEVVINKN